MRCGCGQLWAIEQLPIPSLSQLSHTCPSLSFAKSALRSGSAISHLPLIQLVPSSEGICILMALSHYGMKKPFPLWNTFAISQEWEFCFAIGAGKSPLLCPNVRQDLSGHLPLPKCTQTRKKNSSWLVAAISCYGLLFWPGAFAPMGKICFWHCYRLKEKGQFQMSKCLFSTKPVISSPTGFWGNFYFLREQLDCRISLCPSSLYISCLCSLPTQMICVAQIFYLLCHAFAHGSLSPRKCILLLFTWLISLHPLFKCCFLQEAFPASLKNVQLILCVSTILCHLSITELPHHFLITWLFL